MIELLGAFVAAARLADPPDELSDRLFRELARLEVKDPSVWSELQRFGVEDLMWYLLGCPSPGKWKDAVKGELEGFSEDTSLSSPAAALDGIGREPAASSTIGFASEDLRRPGRPSFPLGDSRSRANSDLGVGS